LKAAKAAGLTPGTWAREHGIDGRSLNAWRMNLSGSRPSETTSEPAPRVVELVPGPAPSGEPRFVVHVGEVSIEVPAEFHDETLVRLIRALRAC
jgi:hypothetical protein